MRKTVSRTRTKAKSRVSSQRKLPWPGPGHLGWKASRRAPQALFAFQLLTVVRLVEGVKVEHGALGLGEAGPRPWARGPGGGYGASESAAES